MKENRSNPALAAFEQLVERHRVASGHQKIELKREIERAVCKGIYRGRACKSGIERLYRVDGIVETADGFAVAFRPYPSGTPQRISSAEFLSYTTGHGGAKPLFRLVASDTA